jgi:hypothetical protein
MKQLCSDAQLVVDLFVNYDCDLQVRAGAHCCSPRLPAAGATCWHDAGTGAGTGDGMAAGTAAGTAMVHAAPSANS